MGVKFKDVTIFFNPEEHYSKQKIHELTGYRLATLQSWMSVTGLRKKDGSGRLFLNKDKKKSTPSQSWYKGSEIIFFLRSTGKDMKSVKSKK